MYLPSRIKSSHLGLCALYLFLLLLPFRPLVKYCFFVFSRSLQISPRQYSQQIERLKAEKLQLSVEVKRLKHLERENEKLQKALCFKEQSGMKLVGVRILWFDPSSWRRIVTVDAGSNKGIRKGAYAIDEEGWLVGKIVEVYKDYSHLMFIEDSDFTLPVFVGQKSFGLLKGSLEGIKIFYIEHDDTVKPKDKVWLSLPPFSFPLSIGEVTQVRKDRDSLFWDVSVKLFSKNPLLHEIFVIIQ